jgi:hypothetical protein
LDRVISSSRTPGFNEAPSAGQSTKRESIIIIASNPHFTQSLHTQKAHLYYCGFQINVQEFKKAYVLSNV